MALTDLLVHLDGSRQSNARLALGVELALRHGAHLAGLHVIEPPAMPLFYGDPAGFIDAAWVQEMITRLEETARQQAAKVQEDFSERLRRDDVKGEWRLAEGVAADVVALHARYADLAILGQSRPEDSLISTGNVPATTMLSSGRPVLVVPYVGSFATVGRKVLVGWKAGREAARAVNDAIPLLQKAQSVKVLAINPEFGIDGEGDLPAADVALHLARHGIKAEAAHTVAKDVPEADVLLNEAADMDADLIVVGGYGHSRAREFLFGGVTRELLSSMTVPVLFSH
jgi:nucleotide-binding universal stress UspA family protein